MHGGLEPTVFECHIVVMFGVAGFVRGVFQLQRGVSGLASMLGGMLCAGQGYCRLVSFA